jgi:lysophospholipase L1-like esterase
MPDKQSNNKPEISEELIRKYLAGELDDRAMHALERQALDDPFLAEALEGYGGHDPDQSAPLAELQQRLEQRVQQSRKGKLRLLYYRWASAAAILVILGLSFLWINRQQSAEKRRELARSENIPESTYKSSAAPDSAATIQAPAATGVTEAPETLIAEADAPAPARKTPAHPAPALREAAKEAAGQPEAVMQEDRAAEAALADVKTLPRSAAARAGDTIANEVPPAAADSRRKEVAAKAAPEIAANANRPAAVSETLAGRVAGAEVQSRKMKQAAYSRASVAKARRIVILGSSTAEGVGPKVPDSAWVNLLRKYLQAKDPRSAVINLAVGGYNSYKILPESADVPFTRPDPDPEHNIDKALSLQPDLIIINMPSNDITEGFSVEEFKRNLATVTAMIRVRGIRYFVTTTQPRNTSAANRRKLQQMREIIMTGYPGAYINYWDGFSSPDGKLLPQYDSGDGVHLNGLGHQLMFDRIKDRVE